MHATRVLISSLEEHMRRTKATNTHYFQQRGVDWMKGKIITKNKGTPFFTRVILTQLKLKPIQSVLYTSNTAGFLCVSVCVSLSPVSHLSNTRASKTRTEAEENSHYPSAARISKYTLSACDLSLSYPGKPVSQNTDCLHNPQLLHWNCICSPETSIHV